MQSVPHQKRLRILLMLLAGFSSAPFAMVVALYVFVVRARFALGRWPVPMQPDPKDLPFAPGHMELVGWLFVASVAGFLPWLVMMVFRHQLDSGFRSRITSLALTLPWLLLVVVLFFDPGRFVRWFMD